MKRNFAIASSLALGASVMLALPVSAGGWAAISLVGPAAAPVAGEVWPLEVQVLQHGVTPTAWEQVSMVGRHAESGMVAAANGRPTTTVGRYVLDVVFPEAGEWTLEFGLHELLVGQPDPATISVGASPSGGSVDAHSTAAEGPACE